MTPRARVAIAAALVLAAAAGFGTQTRAASKAHGLVAFRSCGALLSYARSHANRFVTAYGIGAPRVGVAAGGPVPAASAAAAGTETRFSGTNVQEAGVDEPDIVKTNGSTLFAAENGEVESVDVSTGRPRLLDTLRLADGWSRDLLLYGNHLLVLSRGGFWVPPLPGGARTMIAPLPSTTTLTEVDVSDPRALRVVQTETISGEYVAARMIGSSVRLVSSSTLPIALPYVTPATPGVSGAADALARNRAVVATSRARDWLPTYRLGKHAARPLVQCRDVRRPAGFSGLGMLTVTTIDLAQGIAPVDSTALMTDGRIVYASTRSLYVATERWTVRPLPATPRAAPSAAATEIHAFDISDPSRARYLGSGTVPGYLLSQWSLSEFQGVLRVVSTDTPAWQGAGPAGSSFVTTLRARGGALVQLGQVGDLGKGDRVYAVRMIGDTGYVVTFRQVDPLYTVDLSDPAAPKVVGQLDLPGYSAYLHPISDTLLLGIGQNVDAATNEPTGTQVSLFDVSDPAHPRRIAEAKLGQGWSAAESDHHAFLYWPPTSLVVVPFGQEAVAMLVGRTGIREVGCIVHTEARQSQLPQIDRAVVVGTSLFTVSTAGVAADDLASLAPRGFARFPTPPPTPVPQPGAPPQTP